MTADPESEVERFARAFDRVLRTRARVKVLYRLDDDGVYEEVERRPIDGNALTADRPGDYVIGLHDETGRMLFHTPPPGLSFAVSEHSQMLDVALSDDVDSRLPRDAGSVDILVSRGHW